jgi:hypothetical protein
MKRLAISLLTAAAFLPAGCCNCCSQPSSPAGHYTTPGPSCTTPPGSYTAPPPSSYNTSASPYGVGPSSTTSSYNTSSSYNTPSAGSASSMSR